MARSHEITINGQSFLAGRGELLLDAALGNGIDEFLSVPLPHWRGAGDVFHLMSILSPVDRDLAVVYSPLLPVPFRERLLERGNPR